MIQPTERSRRSAMRRIATGGALGALPGLLMAIVPLLLHDVGAISSDQSQIGFIGLPALIVGIFVGTAIAASGTGCGGAPLLGAGAGFVVGLVAGVLVATAIPGVAGIWIFTIAVGTIAGATLAASFRLRRTGDPPDPWCSEGAHRDRDQDDPLRDAC